MSNIMVRRRRTFGTEDRASSTKYYPHPCVHIKKNMPTFFMQTPDYRNARAECEHVSPHRWSQVQAQLAACHYPGTHGVTRTHFRTREGDHGSGITRFR